MSRPDDLILGERGGLLGGDTQLALVRGSLLDALLTSNLLPAGTVSQVAPPVDTSIFWIDQAVNPRVLKFHNGAAWVGATFSDVFEKQPQEQIFNASGTFTVPSGVTRIYVYVRGGGGGGSGGASSSFSVGDRAGGGGGGAGGQVEGWLTVTPLQSIAVTVGSGGAGSVYSTSVVGGAIPASGGLSSFGSLMSSVGGAGGRSPYGGNGGQVSGGSTNTRGLVGKNAFSRGNGRWFGGAGGEFISSLSTGLSNGISALDNSGAGGSGATRDATNNIVTGGDGGSGQVIVRWFE